MINTAVIGLGNMGKHHARIYNELTHVKLLAVSDIDHDRGREIAKNLNCKFYRDYRAMLQNEPIEAVSIAVPTFLHEEVSMLCIERGLGVLLEKPIASSLAEAERITEAVEKHGVTFQVGHIEHFNPAVIKLKEILNQNVLGDLLTIMVRRVGISPPQIKDANVIIDLAIHDIDLCNSLINKLPDKVYCRAWNEFLYDREDYADIFLEYGRVNVLIQANWITPVKIRQMHLTGSKGYVDLDFIEQKLHLAETIVEQNYDNYGAFVTKIGQSHKIEIPIENKEPLRLEIEHFLDCFSRKATPCVDGKRATDSLRIALEAWDTSKKHHSMSPAGNTLRSS